jgi:hypothetical protein
MKTLKIYPNQIHYNNELNKILVKEIQNIYPQLLPFLNKQILLSDGKNSKKFKIDFLRTDPAPLKNNDFGRNHICYLDISTYSIWLKVSLCFSGGKYEDNTYYCSYIDKSVYIGKVENCMLTEISKPDDIIKDYKLNNLIDIDNEQAKVKKYNSLLSELEQVKNSFAYNHE